MSLEKVTQLASIEIIFPSRAINAAWHTNITEGGEVISGPSIHRKAFPAEDISELMPEIEAFISADYLNLVSENTQQAQLVAQIQAALDVANMRIAQLESQAAVQKMDAA